MEHKNPIRFEKATSAKKSSSDKKPLPLQPKIQKAPSI